MFNRLHEGHQGVSRSQARARLTLYWPGIDHDIEKFVHGCQHCQDHLPSQGKEPLISKTLARETFPTNHCWHWVLCRLTIPDHSGLQDRLVRHHQFGQRYHYIRPNWIFARPILLHCSAWSTVVRRWATVHIVETYMFSHNKGCCTTTIFTTLPSKQWQSWGHRQINEKTAWTGCSVDWEKLCCSLLQYCNTLCCKDSLSPAQKLFGHLVQDHLSPHRCSFAQEWQKASAYSEKIHESSHEQIKRAYNEHTRVLEEPHIGSRVAVQHLRSMAPSQLWDHMDAISSKHKVDECSFATGDSS